MPWLVGSAEVVVIAGHIPMHGDTCPGGNGATFLSWHLSLQPKRLGLHAGMDTHLPLWFQNIQATRHTCWKVRISNGFHAQRKRVMLVALIVDCVSMLIDCVRVVLALHS